MARRLMNMSQVWTASGWDIIGDIHSEYDQLVELLDILGYDHDDDGWFHPDRRCIVFLGDLTDRGRRPVEVLRLVMGMIDDGVALCVNGNHDHKMHRALVDSSRMTLANGAEYTLKQITNQMSDREVDRLMRFYGAMPAYIKVQSANDSNTTVVCAHAGIDLDMLYRVPGESVMARCMYGTVIGENDDGLIRCDKWRDAYYGTRYYVVYGHITVEETEEYRNTICIDTGAGKGGTLSAYRWPERWVLTL